MNWRCIFGWHSDEEVAGSRFPTRDSEHWHVAILLGQIWCVRCKRCGRTQWR